MARLNTQRQTSEPDSDNDSDQGSASIHHESSPTPQTTPSPARNHQSDKENQHSTARHTKRKSTGNPMSRPTHGEASSASKRRKISGHEFQSQAAHRKELQRIDKKYYDPEQDPEERRVVRRGLRSLFSKLNDSRAEYLRPENKGLEDTLREADKLYKSVKQTSEATIDSRLLVETADLSYKKINNLTLGNATTGIDVDDYITKCVGFMKRGDDSAQTNGRDRNVPPSTQTQRRRRQGADEEGEEGDGDTMNWEYLGRNVCFLYNSRPCLTGFLLGPLSVQKKVRQQTQRKAREARSQPTQAVRPIELGNEDLEQQESSSLAVVCTEIARILSNAQEKGSAATQEECDQMTDDPTPDQIREILRRNHMADNGCVPLFDFCLNPRSFGQTVENMFYVSFLIKEGKVGLDFDSNGLPTLGIAATRSVAERQETQRNQAVFALDFDVWEELVNSYGIKKCIIPHRKEEKYDDGILDDAQAEDESERVVEDEDEDEDEDFDAYA